MEGSARTALDQALIEQSFVPRLLRLGTLFKAPSYGDHGLLPCLKRSSASKNCAGFGSRNRRAMMGFKLYSTYRRLPSRHHLVEHYKLKLLEGNRT
jgi:hypothetical protein